MGFMDKVMFWKKDEFDFDSMSSDPFSSKSQGGPAQDNLGLPSDSPAADPFAAQAPKQTPIGSPGEAPDYNPSEHAPNAFSQARGQDTGGITHREIELISSKLDTIKALLASLDQRVGVIEQIARAEQAQQQQNKGQANRLW